MNNVERLNTLIKRPSEIGFASGNSEQGGVIRLGNALFVQIN